MKRINIFVLSGVIALILFIILTILESSIVNSEPKIEVFIAISDIKAEEEISFEKVKKIEMSANLIKDMDIVSNEREITGKVAKTDIFKGEFINPRKLATVEELKIVKAPDGLERIAINIKGAQNAIGYQVKPKDRIHLYFTGRTNTIKDTFLTYGLKFNEVENSNAMQTVKILEDVSVLGIYDEFGISYENKEFSKMDTVVVGVDGKTAELINNLRDQGVFDITR